MSISMYPTIIAIVTLFPSIWCQTSSSNDELDRMNCRKLHNAQKGAGTLQQVYYSNVKAFEDYLETGAEFVEWPEQLPVISEGMIEHCNASYRADECIEHRLIDHAPLILDLRSFDGRSPDMSSATKQSIKIFVSLQQPATQFRYIMVKYNNLGNTRKAKLPSTTSSNGGWGAQTNLPNHDSKSTERARIVTQILDQTNLIPFLQSVNSKFGDAGVKSHIILVDTAEYGNFFQTVESVGDETFCSLEMRQSGGNNSNDAFSHASVLFVSVSFIILMVISLAWLIFYYVQRFRYAHAKDRLARRLFNAAKKALTKIPTRTVKANDAELDADCPVCIDPYGIGDLVRILPCKHVFHKTCVDPWLLEHRTCPMCKADILKAFGYNFRHMEEGIRREERGADLDRGSVGEDSEGGRGSSAGDSYSGYPYSNAHHDSDLVGDPFFVTPTGSPTFVQQVMSGEQAASFSIIPLTVHRDTVTRPVTSSSAGTQHKPATATRNTPEWQSSDASSPSLDGASMSKSEMAVHHSALVHAPPSGPDSHNRRCSSNLGLERHSTQRSSSSSSDSSPANEHQPLTNQHGERRASLHPVLDSADQQRLNKHRKQSAKVRPSHNTDKAHSEPAQESCPSSAVGALTTDQNDVLQASQATQISTLEHLCSELNADQPKTAPQANTESAPEPHRRASSTTFRPRTIKKDGSLQPTNGTEMTLMDSLNKSSNVMQIGSLESL